MNHSVQILPSLLAADFGRLAEEIRRVEASGGDALHLDVMDGRFVRNITMGPDVVAMAGRTTALPLNVHLMVHEPHWLIEAFAEAGSDTILIQVECMSPMEETLRSIRDQGCRAGIVLNPETPAAAAAPALATGLVDELLCMTVHPGFGGQAYLPYVEDKIRALRAENPDLDIMVDGGVNGKTGPSAAAAGATMLVIGSYLFKQEDMAEAIRRVRADAEAARAGEGAAP